MRWSLVVVVFLPACLGTRDIELEPPKVALPLCQGDATSEQSVEPLKAPSALSGGTLAVMTDGAVVAADPDRDLIFVVSVTDQISRIDVTPGAEPGRVVEGPAGRAFVALRRSGKVMELDVAAGSAVASHDACPLPRGLAWSGERSTLYVACAGGELVQLRWSAGAKASRFAAVIAPDLRDVVVTPTGVLVSTFRAAQLYEVSTSGGVRQAPGLVDLPDQAPRVAWRMTSSGGQVLMSHQLASKDMLGVAGCTETPEALEKVSPGTSGYGGSGASRPGAVISKVTPLGANGQPTSGGADAWQPMGALPVDTAASASGALVAVVLAGSNRVVVNTVSSRSIEVSGAVGEPTSVAFRGEELVVFSREPAMLVFGATGGGTRRVVELSTRTVKSSSHERFHRATRAGLACASCHPEAGDDGFTWSIGGEQVRTPSLRGGLSGTEPFHWRGDQADVTALMGDVFRKRMLGPKLSPEQAGAMLTWLDAQPRLPAPVQDAAAVERGRVVFESAGAGCAACHAGAHGTNSAMADVGTGGAFQVPRLDELAYRAPYLHDGRAATLEARFDSGGEKPHGYTAQLSTEQMGDLVTYLRSR